MRRFPIFLFLTFAVFLSFGTAHAQPVLQDKSRGVILDEMLPEMREIDSVRLRVSYIATTVTDTIQDLRGEEKMVLDIGESVVKYYSDLYNGIVYLLSNGFAVIDVLSTIGYEKDSDTWFASIYEASYLNMPDGRITTTGRIGSNDFIYEQELPQINWHIGDSIRTINGYQSQKATCIYKGRHYTAWFTPEIPVPYGPWEFHGLPGLIVSVSDADNYYTFKMADISRPEDAVILYPEYDYIRTTRAKYLDLRKKIEADFGYYFNNFKGQSGMEIVVPEDYEPKALRNDFIELE